MDEITSVLLVDDDAVDRRAVKRALASGLYTNGIIEVDNAVDALACIKNQKFDVVLLDFELPGATGVETILRLKDTPALESTAIIILSNHSSDDIVLECINAGAHDFLLKDEVTAAHLKRSILQSRKRKELEQELLDSYQKVKRLAERDPLTGLHNRYYFDEALSHLLEDNARSANEMVAVMLMDLDKFKHVNDSFGHEMGDKLLLAVTARMEKVVRANELFARLGGDEFAFACGSIQLLCDVRSIATRFLTIFEHPFEIDGHTLYCQGSIGIAVSPLNGKTPEELKRFADIAMYRAKHESTAKLCIFEDNMQQAFLRKYHIEQELRHALQVREFGLYFQPIMNNQAICGAKCLIRWFNGSTTCQPQEFIPVAEEAGLIQQLGRWVTETALYTSAGFRQAVSPDFYLSVNVSPKQLSEAGFALFVAHVIKKNGLNPAQLVIEITETVLMQSDDITRAELQTLSDIGIRVALDDFGTGYSSLSHLLDCPVDIVKVDKSIIQYVNDNNLGHKSVLEGLALMLDKQRISIVAEGVETAEQSQVCHELGIHSHQGFYYYRPLPLTQFTSLLTQ